MFKMTHLFQVWIAFKSFPITQDCRCGCSIKGDDNNRDDDDVAADGDDDEEGNNDDDSG